MYFEILCYNVQQERYQCPIDTEELCSEGLELKVTAAS